MQGMVLMLPHSGTFNFKHTIDLFLGERLKWQWSSFYYWTLVHCEENTQFLETKYNIQSEKKRFNTLQAATHFSVQASDGVLA